MQHVAFSSGLFHVIVWRESLPCKVERIMLRFQYMTASVVLVDLSHSQVTSRYLQVCLESRHVLLEFLWKDSMQAAQLFFTLSKTCMRKPNW